MTAMTCVEAGVRAAVEGRWGQTCVSDLWPCSCRAARGHWRHQEPRNAHISTPSPPGPPGGTHT